MPKVDQQFQMLTLSTRRVLSVGDNKIVFVPMRFQKFCCCCSTRIPDYISDKQYSHFPLSLSYWLSVVSRQLSVRGFWLDETALYR